jgi:hypothetical protein
VVEIGIQTHPPCPTCLQQLKNEQISELKYQGGGDWYSDPSSLPNLLTAIKERTNIRTAPREEIVEITDPKLFQYPYLYMTGHGNVRFADEEIKILRTYFAAGGFLLIHPLQKCHLTILYTTHFMNSPTDYLRFMNMMENLLKDLAFSMNHAS